MLKMMYEHFKTICKHKWIVCLECIKCGFIWRGLMHDNSKFGLAEFLPSAKHFQGNRSPIDAEKEQCGYSLAWLHHMGHNPHHWEYWIDFDADGKIVANKIPYEYVVEMVCDWIGAGITYSKGRWTQDAPLNYYNMVRHGRHFHPETEALIVKFLECIRDKGLKEFYKVAHIYKEQDAMLIAKAPEMYKMLKDCADYLEDAVSLGMLPPSAVQMRVNLLLDSINGKEGD